MRLFKRSLRSDEFVTPDNKVARLVENSDRKAIFAIKESDYTVFYNFDKTTGKKVIRRIYHTF
jgi:hypothetical protein